MALLDYFKRTKPKASAQTAKERLQVIVAHERSQRDGPDYLPALKQDILQVISKYVDIDPEDLHFNIEHTDNNLSVLELNANLPK
ncbi:cell division topological specificity factor MinE [Ferrimonas lipolytica]|uniref:Cell division topological specificity factor n=1 Tax=Ferrimonas lipolytica TaxID=2724191 RepID=A0A6H1UCF3_9GAMM|nr:cell division topological specificity factor MinE [Ferrimonas lipolytica]QIZ76741.1 cell division topological specificity factor MinE [Ferrimonas lipolytica]